MTLAQGDLCLLALGPDLWRPRRFQTEIAAGLQVLESYVSLTEVRAALRRH